MSSEKSFKIATLNVHCWEDASGYDNVDRIIELVKVHDPDILCLQESSKSEQERFLSGSPSFKSAVTNMEGLHVKFGGCSIISKFPMEVKESGMKGLLKCRFVTAEVALPISSKPLFLTCLHLDHRLEPHRLAEEKEIYRRLEPHFLQGSNQIWTGDFNALTREDYTKEYWNEVESVRSRNNWERPETDLTEKVKSRGLIDCWELAKRPEPVKTCRFDTRIDYVFASPSLLEEHKLVKFSHIEDNASDHNMVIAEFKM